MVRVRVRVRVRDKIRVGVRGRGNTRQGNIGHCSTTPLGYARLD
jgi:hypothetical protein